MQQNDKPMGRPRTADGDAFPHNEVDTLLVHGETTTEDNGRVSTKWPSLREIARRYDVSHTLISRFAKNHNCKARRAQVQTPTASASPQRARQASDKSVTTAEIIRFIDTYFDAFNEAFEQGKVRVTSVSDLNTILRLKEHLEHRTAAQEQDLNGLPTLKELQDRHSRMLEDLRESEEAACREQELDTQREDDDGD